MSFSFEGPKWPSPVITWSFATTNYPSDSADPFTDAITQAAYQQVVESAFQAWAYSSGFTFVQIPDVQGQVADIRVGFGDFATANEIGQTNLSTVAEGNMAPDVLVRLLDPAFDPLIPGANGALTYQGTTSTFSQVVLHEIGHALGLGHSDDPDAVMYPFATPQNTSLDSDDTSGINFLYPEFEIHLPPDEPQWGTIFSNSGPDVTEIPQSGLRVVMGPNGWEALISGSYDLTYGSSVGSTIALTGGNDTVAAGSGGDTVDAVGSGSLIFGGPSAMMFINAGSSNMLVAGPGSTYVQNDAQGGTFFGNAAQLVVWDGAGGAIIVGGSGGVLLHGADIGGNDVVFAAPGSATSLNGTTSNNWLIAGAGNDTLDASQATGNELLCSGSGSDLLAGGAGNDFLFAGTGNATMSGGGGANVFEFAAGQAGGADVITDFSATDRILLIGYGPNEAAHALGTQSNTGGSTVIRLSDNTTITLAGAANLNSSNVLTG